LDKPLAAGDHALSLKITSPDGTRALSSQESVRVAVGADTIAKLAESKPEATAAVPSAIGPASQAETSAAPASAQSAPAASPPSQVALAEQPPAGTTVAGPRATSSNEESTPPPPRPTLVFKTVDYEDQGPGAGTVTMTGTADPGAKISLYYDDMRLAEVRAGGDGQWSVEVEKKLGMGQHSFRAERADATDAPAGPAVVTIERVEPKLEPAPVVAAKPGAPTGTAPQVAAAEGAKTQTAEQAAEQALSDAKTYVIRKGDTLWAIAKRYLGGGSRYTSIFEGNRKVIRDPDLIHPKEEVTLPNR
jgi:nucleoid-associated protein YgaU